MSFISKQTITLSKDLLPPPFGNHHHRNGFTASSPVSLSSPEGQKVDFQCLISTSTSHTLVEKSLVDSFNSLSSPFRWIDTDAKDFHPEPAFTLRHINESSTDLSSPTPATLPSFHFTEFNERERDNYRFQCFIDNASFSEHTKHLKVVGTFDFCFTTQGGGHFFRIEKAIVIDGELFFRLPERLMPVPRKEPFRAVLGRNFLENHPHLMLESGEESGFVLSPTLLQARSPCIDTRPVVVAGTPHIALTMIVAGVCHETGVPAKHYGGYGVFLASGSAYNTFRHLPASQAGVRDVDFRPAGSVGFGNAAPKEPATLERALLSAVILAMKMAIRLKVLEHQFDYVLIESVVDPGELFRRYNTCNSDLIAEYLDLTRAFVHRGLVQQFGVLSGGAANPAYLLALLGKEMWPYTGAMTTVQECLSVCIHSHGDDHSGGSRTPSPTGISDQQDSPNTSNERFFFPNVQADLYPNRRKSRSSSMDMTDMAELQVRKYAIARNLLPAGRLMDHAARGNAVCLTTAGMFFAPIERMLEALEEADQVAEGM